MKEYLICYWTEQHNVATDVKQIIKATSLMEALEIFSTNNVFRKISSINEINKCKL